jgi:hypothetical protein
VAWRATDRFAWCGRHVTHSEIKAVNMNRIDWNRTLVISTINLLILAGFVLWTEIDGQSVAAISDEDGPIENASAGLFLLSSICFVIAARRSAFLKTKETFPRYLMIGLWALLMFVFAGEEISWGQRIFGIATPEVLRGVNTQNELNLHNIEFVDTFLGGKFRYLSIMMIMTGLLFPLAALTRRGKQLIERTAFPVAPLVYATLFVGAYLYGFRYSGHLADAKHAEVRELLMAIAIFAFALHGAIRPDELFRAKEDGKARSASPAAVGLHDDRLKRAAKRRPGRIHDQSRTTLPQSPDRMAANPAL